MDNTNQNQDFFKGDITIALDLLPTAEAFRGARHIGFLVRQVYVEKIETEDSVGNENRVGKGDQDEYLQDNEN